MQVVSLKELAAMEEGTIFQSIRYKNIGQDGELCRKGASVSDNDFWYCHLLPMIFYHEHKKGEFVEWSDIEDRWATYEEKEFFLVYDDEDLQQLILSIRGHSIDPLRIDLSEEIGL